MFGASAESIPDRLLAYPGKPVCDVAHMGCGGQPHLEPEVDAALQAGIANERVPLCGTKNLSPVLQHWVSAKKKFECRRHGRTGARHKRRLCRPYGTWVVYIRLPSAEALG